MLTWHNCLLTGMTVCRSTQVLLEIYKKVLYIFFLFFTASSITPFIFQQHGTPTTGLLLDHIFIGFLRPVLLFPFFFVSYMCHILGMIRY